MKIAIPVWNGFISNVFDFATQLVLVDIEDSKESGRSEIGFKDKSLPVRAGKLKELGVDVLVCGAISRPLMYMLTGSGIEVLPYVTGRVDDVLRAYLTGQLVQPQFTMPGCWGGARKGFRGWRRGCRWQGGRQ